jgi:hypothetical protein
MTAAVLLFWGYGLIGTYDALYNHLYRFRLYERPESFREHLLHTANIVLTLPVVAGLYVCSLPCRSGRESSGLVR